MVVDFANRAAQNDARTITQGRRQRAADQHALLIPVIYGKNIILLR
jgi:hypothetical protein